jgi:hypothetical protein
MNVAHAVRSNAATGRPAATRPTEVRADRWRLMVGELSRMDGVAEQLVEDHRADGAGRCCACSTQQAGSTAWPCTLHWLATQALRTVR